MDQANQAAAPVPDEKGYLSQPTGYLFGRAGLLVLLAFLLLAAWNRQVVIAVLLGLVLSAAGLAWLWSRFSLVGVQCQRSLSEPRAFPGEQVEMKLRLANRKLLPLPWAQVDDQIPEPLAPPDMSSAPADRSGFRSLSNTASLLWYTSVSWRCRLLCRKRGYYTLGPTTVSSGDIFGLYPRSTTWLTGDHIIVYPRLFPIAHLDIPSLYPVGETRAERRIFEDPTRTIGVRDYSPTDSLRRVHWKASARHQTLQMKIFEPTTTLTVAAFLAVDSFQGEGASTDDFELGISAAASVANYLIDRRSPVGLFANSRLAGSGQPARIPPASGLGQLVNILEALAKVRLVCSAPFEEFLQAEWSSLPWGTTIMLVIGRPPPTLPGLLAGMRKGGYKVLVLQIGEQSRDGADHTTAWYSVRCAGDLNELSAGRTG